MNFHTDAQQACYEKVAGYIRTLFGEMAVAREDVPAFWIRHGSALAQVSVFPWSDDDATIGVRSWVVTDVEITPDLALHLLRQNDNMRFGAFGVDDDDDIFFEHTIVGATCDKEELRASVLAVLATADEVDDQIVQRWGGQRAIDRLR